MHVVCTSVNRKYFMTGSRDSEYLKADIKRNDRTVFLKGDHSVT